MPLVVVTSRPGLLTDDHAKDLAPYLQEEVAKALHAPSDEGGELTPEEIEVRFREVGPRDVNSSPFGVEVFANEFPSRKANLDQRRACIARALRKHPAVPSTVVGGDVESERGFVWVMLAPASFELL